MEAMTNRQIAAAAIVLAVCLLGTSAVGGEGKGGAPQQQEQRGIPPHPHTEEVSEGQWMFWAAIAAGAFACIAAGIKVYPAIRKRRKKG